MKKRFIAVLMILLCATLLFANGAAETTSAKKQEATPTLNADGTFHLPITDEPKTFTIFASLNNMVFDPEWEVWKEIAKKTNVSMESIIAQSNSNETEAFNLMLSSNNLADIIAYSKIADVEKLGIDGGMLPLNDLIDQYAPHIKEYLETHPKFKQCATALDGNIYFVPKDMTTLSCEYWWIRTDWLDKLGLETPTNVDELYEVLTAFRNQDPNGNGIKDEIPLFDRAGWKMPDEYLYLWDSSTQFYFRDGKAVFEPMTENYKYAVSQFVKWYREGLVDPEIFTRGPKSRDVLFAADVGGFTHDWISTSTYNDTIKIPGFCVEAIAPVADQNGVVKERTVRCPTMGWGISSTCKDPVTVIKFFDYIFTEEGNDYLNWGVEGKSYEVMPDGSKRFMIEKCGDLPPVGLMRQIGAIYRVGFSQTGAYEASTRNKYGNAAVNLYESHPEWYAEALANPPFADGLLDLKIFPEDLSKFKKIMDSIDPYVKEKFQCWILGTADLEEDYDGFIAELKKRGIDEATAIVQRAYDQFLQSK